MPHNDSGPQSPGYPLPRYLDRVWFAAKLNRRPLPSGRDGSAFGREGRGVTDLALRRNEPCRSLCAAVPAST